MRYIVTNGVTKKAYLVTDMGAIASLLSVSKYTIHNWFRKGKMYHQWGSYDIFKGYNTIKSNRMNLDNLKKGGGGF